MILKEEIGMSKDSILVRSELKRIRIFSRYVSKIEDYETLSLKTFIFGLMKHEMFTILLISRTNNCQGDEQSGSDSSLECVNTEYDPR